MTLLTSVAAATAGGYLGACIERCFGVKRGLYGVFRPIYALPAVLFQEKNLTVLQGMILTSFFEFVGSVLFDSKKQKWDYGRSWRTIDGRVELVRTILFGSALSIWSSIPDEMYETIAIISIFSYIALDSHMSKVEFEQFLRGLKPCNI
jgi:uncharacterized membrane protein